MKVLEDNRLGVINKPGTSEPMIINLNETDSGPSPPEDVRKRSLSGRGGHFSGESNEEDGEDVGLIGNDGSIRKRMPPTSEEARKAAFQGGCTCSWIVGSDMG